MRPLRAGAPGVRKPAARWSPGAEGLRRNTETLTCTLKTGERYECKHLSQPLKATTALSASVTIKIPLTASTPAIKSLSAQQQRAEPRNGRAELGEPCHPPRPAPWGPPMSLGPRTGRGRAAPAPGVRKQRQRGGSTRPTDTHLIPSMELEDRILKFCSQRHQKHFKIKVAETRIMPLTISHKALLQETSRRRNQRHIVFQNWETRCQERTPPKKKFNCTFMQIYSQTHRAAG